MDDGPGPAGVVARGAAMGLADAVPGVSGGTIALLTGIHPRLVRGLAHLRPSVLRRPGGLRDADLPFLLLLGSGLVTGLLLGARVLVRALESDPFLVASVLLGLVLGGVRSPARAVRWDAASVALALSFGLAGFVVTVVQPVTAPDAPWFLPVAGAVAAMAMILPGISGAYLLLLMGLYEPVLRSVAALDLAVVGLVGAGALVGLLSFSRFLHVLLERRRGPTHAAMVGLLLGSLGRLWPWRSESGFAAGSPALPDGGWALALGGAAVGWLLVRVLETAVPVAKAKKAEDPHPP